MLLRQFPDKETFCSLAKSYNVIPVCAQILADTETPVSLLRKVYNRRGPVFLLESVEGGEKWGRYSFLGVSAKAELRIYKEHIEIRQETGISQIPHAGNPLTVLKSFMQRYRPATPRDLPRFWGGLVGYFSYETVSFFENIANRWPADKPLGHFIVPDALLIFDNIQHSLLSVAVAFPASGSEAEAAFEDAVLRLKQMQQIIGRPLPDNSRKPVGPGTSELKSVIEEAVFRHQVSLVKDYIRQGEVIQTVIAQPFVCDPPSDILYLYQAQRFINPSPYLFFMHIGDMTLVGSSPETMVRLENRIATLRPIAGTRRRGNTEQEDRTLADELLADEKERAEHLMLVDLGRNDLGRVAQTGTVQVTDLMIVERYSHVMHLVSNIVCHLKPECDAWDLLRASFPAGTLSGAPKVRAMEIIAELEKEPRGPYGGAVGYISFHGNMDLAITIRTACVENGKLVVRAGAGIVADSDPECERMETVNKAKAIQKALELIQSAGSLNGKSVE